MAPLVGTPSDEVPGILAAGRSGVSAMFVSMSERHPEGRDADYLEWHSLDHRPEQHRMAALRASLRLVSTPACRAARAAGTERYDAVDHVMTYFFADAGALGVFLDLSLALRGAGRTPYLLPLVERGVFGVEGTHASERVKVGADVLPWWPARGVFIMVEQGGADPVALTEMAGVAGAWWAGGVAVGEPHATADHSGLQLTYLFLDGDPAETGERLRPLLDARWADGAVAPLLAAPFHSLVYHEWDRYLP